MNKLKGKIIVVGMGLLLGVGSVAATLGLEVVNGPEGALCFAPAKEAPAPVVAE